MSKQEQRKQMWQLLLSFKKQGYRVNVRGVDSLEKMQNEYNRITNRLRQLAVALQRQSHRILLPVQAKSTDYKVNASIAEKIKPLVQQIPIGAMINLHAHTFTHISESKTISKIIDILPYDDDEEALQQLKSLYWTNNNIAQQQHQKAYRFSDSVNCLVKPIRNMIQQRMDQAQAKSTQKTYKTLINHIDKQLPQFEQLGAIPELIQQLVEVTNGCVKIYNPLDSRQYIKFHSQSKQKAQYKIHYLNTRFDHVDMWSTSSSKIKQVEIIKDILEDGMSSQQIMNEISFAMQNSGESFIFKRNQNGEYIFLQQGLNVSIREDFHQLQVQMNDMRNSLKDLNLRLNKQQIDLVNQFLNGSQNLQFIKEFNYDNLRHIDIRKGYTVGSRLNQYYKGFVYATQLRYCDNELALKYNGLYVVDLNINDCPRLIQMVIKESFRKHYYLTHPILVFLHNHNVKFNVIAGFYGQDSKMLEYIEEWLIKHYDNKGAYFMVPSMAMRDENIDVEQMCYISDQRIAELTGKDDLLFYPAKKPNEYVIKRVVHDKDYNSTLKMYSAQVLQYQQLAMMIQLQHMDTDKIVSMIGDDIYYLEHDFKLMSYMSTSKDNSKFEKISWQQETFNTFIYNPHSSLEYNINLEEICGQPRPLHQLELYLAPGGFGKSHQILTDKGNISILYTTLTNDLVIQQGKKFEVKSMTCDMLIAKQKELKFTPSCIVIDEIGLTGYGKILQIKQAFPNSVIYCLGDDLQLCSLPHPKLFNPESYDVTYDESHYKIDYRAKCAQLKCLKKQIREMMREGKSEYELFKHLKKQILMINRSFLPDRYNSDSDIIVTATNNRKDAYTELLKNKQPKYRVIKTFTKDGVTYCTGQILNGIPFESKNFQLQHAFTCHSLQGLTHKGKMFINCPPNTEDPVIQQLFRGYIYTAISRCVYKEQLIIIE